MTTLNNPSHTRPLERATSARPVLLGPIVVYGFAAVVAMWCAWLLSHTPGLDAPPAAVAMSLIAALSLTTFMGGWSVARGGAQAIAWKVGGGAGCLAAAVTLLLLASHIVEQSPPGTVPAAGMSGLRPTAFIYIPGFLVVAAIIGAVTAVVGSLAGRKPPPPDGLYAGHDHWLSRFALVTAAAVFPVIVLGGFVTSTASGMAVTGWPDSYGANMFLFPISLMSEPRIFLEHSHRLFGSMAGLSVLTLTIYALRHETRPRVRLWIVGMFIVVCVQGLLGGLRVVHNHTDLAILH
ncbi:MAG TPA: COX15/CtaA family protein, partial [Phycisphaerales bacterium]|nr:COX15/CtaA family protein [Phycisphaerales bacterium]